MLAEVKLWGRTIGAVSLDTDRDVAAFQYSRDFARSGIQVSPIVMPLSDRIYTFPSLSQRTFHGLPGLLADSLPDKFGNALIDAWLSTKGRSPASFSSVERLCYAGARGMGALEFSPAIGPRPHRNQRVDVDALVELASEVLSRRAVLSGSFESSNRERALSDILRVGTSAGGARAKAVIAWNRETNEVRSGQVPAEAGFEYWLLKFDGVKGNKDKELDDPQGYGAIEYAYSMMAKAAGIQMNDCRILEENGRRHFMTKRFDRLSSGEKLHMQSLCALAHFDFNEPGAYAYEQAFMVMRQMKLASEDFEEQYRRMVFNIIARNQDDHVKNIAFLMNKSGVWALAPAFDVTYSYNPTGEWTSMHQMTMNGKRDDFTLSDFRQSAKTALLKRGTSDAIIHQVNDAVKRWPQWADQAHVVPHHREAIQVTHRLAIPLK